MQKKAGPQNVQTGLPGTIQDTQFEFQINKFVFSICCKYCMGHNNTKITYGLSEIQV